MAADVGRWDKTRADFLRATLGRFGCRVEARLQGGLGAGGGGGFGGGDRDGMGGDVQEGDHSQRERHRMEMGHAALEEIWRLPAVCGRCGFVLVVDSANVAGWLSGRNIVAAESVNEMVVQAWDTLEVLILHLGCSPLATDWVIWVPREINQGADWLAGRALETRQDAWYWHASWWRFKEAEVVIHSDAGVRVQEGGDVVEVGLGWVMTQHSTGHLVAAASWALSSNVSTDTDVNTWEMRAALAGAGALVFLRTGRVGEVWKGVVAGEVLSLSERRKLNRLNRMCKLA